MEAITAWTRITPPWVRARASGRRRIVISSQPEMTSAHRMYLALGFVRRPDLDWSPVPGVDLLGFSLEL